VHELRGKHPNPHAIKQICSAELGILLSAEAEAPS
jgi:hypothetical protein